MFSLYLFASFFLACVYSLRSDYSDDALGDAITTLPGLDPATLAKYNMFSGYIDVYPPHNRSIFYWFIESLNKPTTDPVAIWTNGGPGCSGLAGMFTEQGPFRPNKDLSLYVNDYSWVNVANMVFFEAPAGVGFSFSDNSADYTTDDNKTAIDNYHFIQGWLTKFPNYQSNDFYITSESYGGHYMPTLTQQIIIGNNAGGSPAVNFKGVFLGNPFTDPVENEKGTYDTWYGHQLVSYPTWHTWYVQCNDGSGGGTACSNARHAMNNELGNNIDTLALDYPVCHNPVKTGEAFWFLKEVVHGALKRPIPLYYQDILDSYEKKVNLESPYDHLGDYQPCEGDWMTSYLNQKSVQTAIHAELKGKTHWVFCGGINYSYASSANPMEPTYKWIFDMEPNLHYTIVSGDDDSNCGTLGTQSWIYNMGYTISSPWTHWTDSAGQTGGYHIKFKNAFNFLTVHSAGHMIPETQPMRSLESFTRYLSGEF
jgi:carboxypeptidase C (cathepsin A)